MTTKQIINHPNTTATQHVLLGAVAAVLFQQGIDLHEQMGNLTAILQSHEFHGLLVAVLAAFNVVKSSLAQQPSATLGTATLTSLPMIASATLESLPLAANGKGTQLPSPPDFPPPVAAAPKLSDKQLYDAFMRIVGSKAETIVAEAKKPEAAPKGEA
jgi:hypothetical protein